VLGVVFDLGADDLIEEVMLAGIFLSYRREDSRHFAGRLFDSISSALPNIRVFMDVDSIRFGEDFVDVLNEQLNSCQALLVVIGPSWLQKRGDTGKTNLDDPDDFIRIEIETAITRKIPVIPVLVDGAQMPAQNEIPETLRPLRRRQFIRIDHDNYNPVVKQLVVQLSELVNKAAPSQQVETQTKVSPPADTKTLAGRARHPMLMDVLPFLIEGIVLITLGIVASSAGCS